MVALLCWVTMPLFIKYFTRFFDQYTQNGLRFSVAAALWVPALIWKSRQGRLDKRLWYDAAIPAILMIGGQTFWAWSMYYLDPGLVSFVVQISVLWAVIFGMGFFRDERALLRSAPFWMALVLGCAGYLMLVLGGPQRAVRASWIGVGLVTACAMLWALQSAAVRWRLGRHATLPAFAVVALYSAVGLDLLMLRFGRLSDVSEAGPLLLVIVAASAVVGIGIANVFWYAGIKRLGVTVSSGLLLAWPFLTALLSVVFGREWLSVVQWFGGGLLVAGAGLLLWAQRTMSQAPTDLAEPAGRRPVAA